eukprot:793763-Amorphochlora_amoeboformis.AAC.1
METASGLRFAASTPPNTRNMQVALGRIYRLYVDYVLRNPSYRVGTVINLAGFNQRVDAYVREIAG